VNQSHATGRKCGKRAAITVIRGDQSVGLCATCARQCVESAGSSASISPPFGVFEIAPAQILQSAVRLHELASSPTTQTRFASPA
jgi:hypothetical protein